MEVSATKVSAQVEGVQRHLKAKSAKDVDLFAGFMSMFQDHQPIQSLEERQLDLDGDELMSKEQLCQESKDYQITPEPLYGHIQQVNLEESLLQVNQQGPLSVIKDYLNPEGRGDQSYKVAEDLSPKDGIRSLDQLHPLPITEHQSDQKVLEMAYGRGVEDPVALERKMALNSDHKTPITGDQSGQQDLEVTLGHEVTDSVLLEPDPIASEPLANLGSPPHERKGLNEVNRKNLLGQEGIKNAETSMTQEAQVNEKRAVQSQGFRQSTILNQRRDLQRPQLGIAVSQDDFELNRITVEEHLLNQDPFLEDFSGIRESEFSLDPFRALSEVDQKPVQEIIARADYSVLTNESEVKAAIRQQLVVLREQDTTKLLLRLYPQHLGAMSVELKMKNGVILANVVLDQIEAKPLIEQAFSDLNLDQVPLESLNVEINQHHNQREKEEPTHHDRAQASQTIGDESQSSPLMDCKSAPDATRLLNLKI